MIFEHEIPEGSRLYFASSAKEKRNIEQKASQLLEKSGFLEIVTPLFSYQQHQSIGDDKELISVNDAQNHNMSIRADTTIDAVRIITKRLGRNTTHRRWFYIQPVYRYPSFEQNQIGAEMIASDDLKEALDMTLLILEKLDQQPLLQISNIKIPQLLSKSLQIPLDDFKHMRIDKLLSLNIEWLTELIYLQDLEQIDRVMQLVPKEIRAELAKIKELAMASSYRHSIIAPLYYTQMLYYDELYFRLVKDNSTYAQGGRYINEGVVSVGFAIYTDILIEEKEDNT